MCKHLLPILSASLLFFSIDSCGQSFSAVDFQYDLDRPDVTQKLPKVLEEISGLAYAGENRVYCIQDEKGRLFLYDLDKEEIILNIPFGGPGDYEGIAKAEDTIYVLRSDGKLYSFCEPASEEQPKRVTTTFLDLGKQCNAEGLEYDSENYRLLVACKGESKKSEAKKRFYEIIVPSEELSAQVVFSFSAFELRDSKNWISRTFYDRSIQMIEKLTTFNPSGIARHPVTGELYVLSSVGKMLVVFSDDAKLKQIVPLNEHRFIQPEGITFDGDANLFISNEGRGGHAILYRFSWSGK